ncbi:hypothetical protein ACO0SA_001984 [Hanseniaspora valbyensis]
MGSEEEYIPDENELLKDVAENAVFNIALLEEQQILHENEGNIEAPTITSEPTDAEIDSQLKTPTAKTTVKKRGRTKGVKSKKIEIENEEEEEEGAMNEYLNNSYNNSRDEDFISESKTKRKKTNTVSKKPRKNASAASKAAKETINIEDYLFKVNRENESRQELIFSDKETIKDQLTLLTKAQLKIEKVVGTSDKETLVRYARCLNWFKTPLPPPTEEGTDVKFMPLEPYPILVKNKIKLFSQNTQTINLALLPSSHSTIGSKKQKITFDDISKLYELETNQSMKLPEKICGTSRNGYVINHGTDTQVTDSKWVTFNDRQFYIVSKITGRSFLDKAYDPKLSMFYNKEHEEELEDEDGDDSEEGLNYLIEIWEFKKNIGLIMLKDYMHNFGILTQLELIPGSMKTIEAGGNNYIQFLLSFSAQSESIKIVELDTSMQGEESMIELITSPLVNIKYLNDKITSYCLITNTLICVGTYSGRVALFDLNESDEIPFITTRVGETLVDQVISIADTTVIAASLYDGQVIIFDYKCISTTITTISKNVWISPPIIESTDFTKGILHTDGQRSMFNSPLNCLDAKFCSLNITSIISCIKSSKHHPYILVGTSNGEIDIVNSFLKSLLSKRAQSDCVYTKIFNWRYDQANKVYQLDGTYEVAKTTKLKGSSEFAFNYKGCAIKKCEWIDDPSGERYFSFLNSAGITVITKLD